mgnify:CR=1 FL=1
MENTVLYNMTFLDDIYPYFIDKYFKDTVGLVVPIHPLDIQIDEEQMKKIFIVKKYFLF